MVINLVRDPSDNGTLFRSPSGFALGTHFATAGSAGFALPCGHDAHVPCLEFCVTSEVLVTLDRDDASRAW